VRLFGNIDSRITSKDLPFFYICPFAPDDYDSELDITIHQNVIAKELGATISGPFVSLYNNDVSHIDPIGSGRFFEVDIEIPANVSSKVKFINFSADVVPKPERHLR